MTLEELETQLKEMRDLGATGNTEIDCYSHSTDLDFIITDINFYLQETRPNYIELTLHEKF